MIDEKDAILLVDDDPGMQNALRESLKRCGYQIQTASEGEEGVQRFLSGSFRMVITDVKMKGKDGIYLLKEIKRHDPEIPVLIMTAYGTIDNAVEAMKLGASDYLLKPFSIETLEEAVMRGLRGRGLQAASVRASSPSPKKKQGSEEAIVLRGERMLITQDPAMRRLIKTSEHVAASQATVLIHGESGTGKELLARFIHERSQRQDRPFVAINCAAIPEGLLESELFGHERGAFTGAIQKKPGKFLTADKGTLLLDEIGEMGLPLQAKLLRVLQERVVDTIGGQEPIEVDIRVIATTHRNLRKEVDSGRFREDLYYRLNVFPLTLAPLRERRGDIPILVRHFLEKYPLPAACLEGHGDSGVADEALDMLMLHDWRGNIRELENVMERAILLSRGGRIQVEHLILEGNRRPPDTASNESSGSSVHDMERQLILRTLEEYAGNRTRAAKALGIGLRTLRNKLREYREEGIAITP